MQEKPKYKFIKEYVDLNARERLDAMFYELHDQGYEAFIPPVIKGRYVYAVMALDGFRDWNLEHAPEAPEEVEIFLVCLGYDPDELAVEAKTIFRQALEESPMNPKNRSAE